MLDVVEDIITYAIRFRINNPNMRKFFKESGNQAAAYVVTPVNWWLPNEFGNYKYTLLDTGQAMIILSVRPYDREPYFPMMECLLAEKSNLLDVSFSEVICNANKTLVLWFSQFDDSNRKVIVVDIEDDLVLWFSQFYDSNKNVIVADIGHDLIYSAIMANLVGKLVAAYLIAHSSSLLNFVKQPEMQHKKCLNVSRCNEPTIWRMAWVIFHIPWVPEPNILWLCIMAFQALLREMFLLLVDPGDSMRLNQFQKTLSFQLGALKFVIPSYFRMKITSNAIVTTLEADKVKGTSQG